MARRMTLLQAYKQGDGLIAYIQNKGIGPDEAKRRYWGAFFALNQQALNFWELVEERKRALALASKECLATVRMEYGMAAVEGPCFCPSCSADRAIDP